MLFKTIQNYHITTIQPFDYNSIIDISDNCFGKNYLTTENLSYIIVKNGFYYKIVLNNRIIGFCLAQIHDTDTINTLYSEINIKKNLIINIKTLAIHSNYQQLGYGTKLLLSIIKKIKTSPKISAIYYPLWIESESANFSKILINEGFTKDKLFNNYWKEDSLIYNYECISCGLPPCTCSMQLYKKEL